MIGSSRFACVLSAIAALVPLAGCSNSPTPSSSAMLPGTTPAATGSSAVNPSFTIALHARGGPIAGRSGTVPPSIPPPGPPYVYSCDINNNDCLIQKPPPPNNPAPLVVRFLALPQGTRASRPGIAYGGKSAQWFIANTNANNVPIYDIFGNGPVLTLNDANQYPVDVAIRAAGTPRAVKMVIVSNIFSLSHGAPSISIYTPPFTNLMGPTGFLNDPVNAPAGAKGLGVAFDQKGNCYWSFETADRTAGRVDEFKGCTGKAVLLPGPVMGFVGGIAFDGKNNLWFADQFAQTINRCVGVVTCGAAAGFPAFVDPIYINFNASWHDLYVADYGASQILRYTPATGAQVGVIGYPASNPPSGVGTYPPPAW